MTNEDRAREYVEQNGGQVGITSLTALLDAVRAEAFGEALAACDEEIASYDSGTSPRYAAGVNGAKARIEELRGGETKENTMIPIDENEAKWIRVLRVDLNCSWGRVAELFAAATGRTVNGGGTLGGADLCRYAASMLGENVAMEPWN